LVLLIPCERTRGSRSCKVSQTWGEEGQKS
jgi:hypothetical protein